MSKNPILVAFLLLFTETGVTVILVNPGEQFYFMNKTTRSTTAQLVDKLIKEQAKLNTLPPLNELEKAKFEHSIDIDHLYFSSKLEGSNLTKKQIDQAVHGTEI